MTLAARRQGFQSANEFTRDPPNEPTPFVASTCGSKGHTCLAQPQLCRCHCQCQRSIKLDVTANFQLTSKRVPQMHSLHLLPFLKMHYYLRLSSFTCIKWLLQVWSVIAPLLSTSKKKNRSKKMFGYGPQKSMALA